MMVSVYEEDDDVGGVVYAVLDLYCSSCIFFLQWTGWSGSKKQNHQELELTLWISVCESVGDVGGIT